MHSFKELAASFEQRFTNSLPFPAAPGSLYEPCRYLLQLGGKRIRPVVCLMANELFADISEDAWNGAIAVELFHNFTLIHDDIMDKAPLRRGSPTVHAKYGMTAGILCGDVMNIFAYDSLAKIQVALQQILQLFNKTAIEVCEGQKLDMDFETRNDVSLEEYIHMVTLKTSVLLACSLKIGALAAGCLGDSANKLYEFGKNLGIAFQLQDDYLDAYGDAEMTGKQNGGDIFANKKTFLLVTALQNATTDQRNEIQQLIDTNPVDKIPSMLALYAATGADSACREKVAHYSELAFSCLEEVAIPSRRKEQLHELATYLLQREK